MKETMADLLDHKPAEQWPRSTRAGRTDAKGEKPDSGKFTVYTKGNSVDLLKNVKNLVGATCSGWSPGLPIPVPVSPIFKNLVDGEPDQKGGSGGNGGPTSGRRLPIFKHIVKNLEEAFMNLSAEMRQIFSCELPSYMT